jgi:hypothetical protein
VFISYSSRLRDARELRSGDTLNRHQYRKRHLTTVLSLLETRLEDSGFEVWIDRNQVSPGEEFEDKISFALYDCDIGLILLDLDALDSGYVRKEATILMWRHMIDGIRVMPILIGGVTVRDLTRSDLGATVGLGNLSVLRAPTSKLNGAAAESLVEAIISELPKATKPTGISSPSVRWIQDFVHFTSGISAERLWRVAECLGVDIADWARARDRHQVVAGAMLGADMLRVHRALVQLVGLLDEDGSKTEAVRRALPLWVDLDVAKIVVDVEALPAGRRVLAIATPAYRLGEHVIQRATFSAQEYGTHRLPDVTGERAHSELLQRYDSILRRVLHFFTDDTPEDIAHELNSLGGGVFALMRCENLPPFTAIGIIESLQKRFPGVTFVVLAKRENVVWEKIDAPLAYRTAREDWERSARRYVSRTASLIGEHIAVESDE